MPALSPDQIDVPLDYDSLGAIGTFFGAASLIVVDDRCCMVQLALRSTKFYMHESCGKCTPCREGTRWMVQILERLEAGTGSHADIDLLRSVGSRILGKSLCALGDFAVYPVASYVAKWGEEFEQHVELGRCPYDGESTLDGIVAPSDAHARTATGCTRERSPRGVSGRTWHRTCPQRTSRFAGSSFFVPEFGKWAVTLPFALTWHRTGPGGTGRSWA